VAAAAPPPATAAVAAAPAPAESAPSPSSLSASELDQLAGALYERVRFRLRAELRRDRERAGFLTDIVH